MTQPVSARLWARARRRVTPSLTAGLLGFAGLTGATSASAQASAADKAAAETLFDEGLSLMKTGNYAEACKRLESSQRIDPGIGTLLYLAECYENVGKTASAWATFREAASAANAAGQERRAALGRERAEKLKPLLSKLTITLAAGNESIEGLEVLHGGRPVAKGLWGTPIPVDPGPHELVVRAPGYEPFTTEVTVEAGGKSAELEVPPLTKAPEAANPTPTAPETAAASHSTPAQVKLDAPVAPGDSSSSGSTQRTAGLAVAGLGVVGLGVGTFFGLKALSKSDEEQELCETDAACPEEDRETVLELNQDARDAATLSNIGFIAGGVLAAGGLVLYLTAPDDEDAARLVVTPTVGGAQIRLGGAF